jgi:hypothetical protein
MLVNSHSIPLTFFEILEWAYAHYARVPVAAKEYSEVCVRRNIENSSLFSKVLGGKSAGKKNF